MSNRVWQPTNPREGAASNLLRIRSGDERESELTPSIALALAAGIGLLSSAAGDPKLSIAVISALGLISAITINPRIAPYVWLVVCPLIVGVARGNGLSVLRPNEALLVLLLIGVGFYGLRCLLTQEGKLPRLNAVDLSMGSLAFFGTVLPLSLRYGRGLPLTLDDVLYAMVFVKYLCLYITFRVCIRTAAQVKVCLWLILLAGFLVAIVALLQVKGLFSVPELLSRYYDSPFEGLAGATTLRGSSTIASSFGLADTMAMSLGISVAWASKESRLGPVFVGAALLFLGGIVAAGSVSGIIGGAVVIAVVGFVTGRGRLMLGLGLPAIAMTAFVFWPVIAARIAAFDNRHALPKGWIGRVENLETFFWPELFSGFNWFWGVRPAARVAAPEAWRDWVYIESGHTWLLWTGGLPLFFGFFVFVWLVAKGSRQSARLKAEPLAIAGAGALGAVAMIFALMIFDPHLTVRGTADLFFPLVALALVREQDEASNGVTSGAAQDMR